MFVCVCVFEENGKVSVVFSAVSASCVEQFVCVCVCVLCVCVCVY